jgi:hypothetical protein
MMTTFDAVQTLLDVFDYEHLGKPDKFGKTISIKSRAEMMTTNTATGHDARTRLYDALKTLHDGTGHASAPNDPTTHEGKIVTRDESAKPVTEGVTSDEGVTS